MSDLGPIVPVFRLGETPSYYVVHGHGGVPRQNAHETFILDGVEVLYYCGDGRTTSDGVRRNVNADWPKLLNRLLMGSTQPLEHVVEVSQQNQRCRALRVHSGDDIPASGVYYAGRARLGDAARQVKIADLPREGIFLQTLIDTVIRPHATAQGLAQPWRVHWLACRVAYGPVPEYVPEPMDIG